MTTRIVIAADSTADFPLSREELKNLGISIVPAYVIIGGKEMFQDGIDISREEIARRITENPDPRLYKTSQPNPAQFAECYKKLIKEGAKGIISIHPPKQLSGTYNSARLGSEMVKNAGVEINLIDSDTVSYGLGMLVLEAARMAKAGANQQEIVDEIEKIKSSIYLYAFLDSLAFVKEGRGGIIKGFAANIGSKFKLRAIINLHNGKLAISQICRTREQGKEGLVKIFRGYQSRGIGNMGMIYTPGELGKIDAERLGEQFKDESKLIEIPCMPTGPALTVQVGLNVVAFFLRVKS